MTQTLVSVKHFFNICPALPIKIAIYVVCVVFLTVRLIYTVDVREAVAAETLNCKVYRSDCITLYHIHAIENKQTPKKRRFTYIFCIR